MKIRRIALLLCLCLLTGCGRQAEQGESKVKQDTYTQITATQAKAMIDEKAGYIVLDVRGQEEYDEGHIKDALLIPDTEIGNRAEQELIDKDATILVYCRSGRRSKLAAQELADLGFTNIYEFGGIIDWQYDIVK